jgi:transposase-like protein
MSIEISDPIYHDENAARAYFEALRWPNGVTCPLCGVADQSAPLNGNSMGPGWYYCSACKDKFTVRVGTVYERSHIPLTKWAYAFRMMNSSKNGVSAHELHRTLNITYKSAWFMAHRIREAMAVAPTGPLGGAGKVVEADEAYLGGKEKNKHRNKRAAHGDAFGPKQAVVTLVERDGSARSFHVANVTAKTLRPVVTKAVDRQSHLMTDSARVYPKLGEEFAAHSMVDHSAGEYVRGGFHYTNTVENYFSNLKRGVDGTYRHVSEAHLIRYLGEFDFRYSNRSGLGVNDVTRTGLAIKGAEGKRLTYRPARKTRAA